MQFRIADTFSDSLAKLNGREQKAAKTTAFDLQLESQSGLGGAGLQLHKLERGRDPAFWSVRVSRDLRIIVHRTSSSFMLCYVGHHDDAYAWAERRRIEQHPKTGAAQLVEVRETVREVVVPVHVPVPSGTEPEEPEPGPIEEPLFADRSVEELLGWGVPAEWVSEVREASERTLLELAEHLPAEAAEALLQAAVGEEPTPAAVSLVEDLFAEAGDGLLAMVDEPTRAEPSLVELEAGDAMLEMVDEPTPAELSLVDADAFEHPDAQRRFRTLRDRAELERALEFPWEKWAVFLHPRQRAAVEREYAGPARVSGSAGTGKTVVALHRAVFLTRRDPDARTLLTTFSEPLARALRTKLWRLAGNEPKLMERLDVESIGQVATGLYRSRIAKAELVSESRIRELLRAAAAGAEIPFSENFLWLEWHFIVDAWNLRNWEDYREVPRTGRRTRIGAKQREALWAIFEGARGRLKETGEVTRAQQYHALADALAEGGAGPYDYVVADESQDLGVPELRFLGALAPDRPNALFFSGDLGQRIFQPPFSWKALGIDVRGRSQTLVVNYRTTHQIRQSADRLLPETSTDVDGVEESRRGTVSVFNGPSPDLRLFESAEEESKAVGKWLRARLEAGCSPDEVGVFVRSEAELPRARQAIDLAGAGAFLLDENGPPDGDKVALGTMHRAKGLEFRAVAVMACDDEAIPNQSRIESAGDLADVEEIYDTERHLLYVACTRARDDLWVSGVEPGSEFLEDMRPDRRKAR